MNKEMKFFSMSVTALLIMGCMGQAPAPQPTEAPTTNPPTLTSAPTCPPTVGPSTVPPVTITSVPPTTLPTTPAPTPTKDVTFVISPEMTQVPSPVAYYGIYVPNIDWDSYEFHLFGMFIRDLYDTDDTDIAFFQDWIYFYYMKYSSTSYTITSKQKWEKAKKDGLQKIKGIGNKEVQNMINYVDGHLNNDIVVEFVKGKDYSVIYIGTDGLKETSNVIDEHASLTRLDIYRGKNPRIGNPDLAKVTNLDPEHAAIFYVLPNNALDQFFNFMASP